MDERAKNPCHPCAYFKERKVELLTFKISFCNCPDRVSALGAKWTSPTGKPHECPYFVQGEQLTLEDM